MSLEQHSAAWSHPEVSVVSAGAVDDMPGKLHTDVWWRPPLRFVVESLTGVFLFGVVAAAAVGVSISLRYLEWQGVDIVIAYGLQADEYGLFAVDLVLFARFLWKSSLRTWRAL